MTPAWARHPDRDALVLVAGGGAAGLMAAGQAAEAGARVTVLEKMARPGRKLCITGKGRCNLTNTAPLEEFLGHFGPSGRFLRQAFHRFFAPELLAFFAEHGLETVSERGGRIFPASGKATEVCTLFERWLRQRRVRLLPAAAVESLHIENNSISGVLCAGRTLPCRALILATGGASYPATGSTGDGYSLARQAGHRIVPIRPALVPLVTAEPLPPMLSGLQLRNILVRFSVDGKRKGEAFGELAFTEFGLSGPVILTLSGRIVDALEAGRAVELSLDLKPALDDRQLDARLQRDLRDRGGEPLRSILRGLLPAELIDCALAAARLEENGLGRDTRAEERRRLRSWLKNFRLPIAASRPLAEAIITAGGVDTREVDPRTMQSRLVEGLFFAGELLDLQADTGGYNLQAAFSTGWLAGRSAAAFALGPHSA